jgi:peptidoglycan-N-acetylglucosamine deacetylase
MNKKYCLLTNDVETTSIINNLLSDKTGELVLKEGMPLLLNLYDKYNIRSTFFFTGEIAKKFPDVVRMILPYGHEVACHGLTHRVDKSFDILSLTEQIEHLSISKKILEDISGNDIISFRAPALRVNKYTVEALEKTGFLIDSSIASQRFDMFMSFGSIKKFKWLIAPRNPYQTDNKSLFKKGNSRITEIPISALIIPYIGTTMRIFPSFTSIVGRILNLENNFNDKPINILIHPNEFIYEERDFKTLPRRSNNFFSYLFSDYLRNKLKQKNLGKNLIPIYEKEIKYFLNKRYKFTTLRDYVENGLLTENKIEMYHHKKEAIIN